MKHLTTSELEQGLDYIKQSPKDNGEIKLMLRRPEEGKREVLEVAQIDTEVGVVGDNWRTRGSSRTNNGLGHPDMQINMMNARAIELIAVEKERWKWAGDQLYVDLDLSYENLPFGTQLQVGTAILEVTEIPHRGCKKFVERFGLDAMKFVNSDAGVVHNLRGINLKVIKSGIVEVNSTIKKLIR